MITQRLGGALNFFIRGKLHIELDVRQIHIRKLNKFMEMGCDIASPFEPTRDSPPMVLFHSFKASPKWHPGARAITGGYKKRGGLRRDRNELRHYVARRRYLAGFKLGYCLPANIECFGKFLWSKATRFSRLSD